MKKSPEAGASGALVVENVVKRYGQTKALDGASLRIDPGEFVALLGQNGAGKTTLFQLLTGLFVADAGDIWIDGHDVRRNAVPALASLGVVFQQQTLDLDLTVIANLQFHARLHGMSRQRRAARISEELSRLGLTDRAQDKTRALSGGMRRRLELARALLHEPRFLLMDEPTVGLDPASRRDLRAYVLDLCRARRCGVLWATHLVDEAEQARRVVILHRGKVLRSGAPAELLQQTGHATLGDAFMSITTVATEKDVGILGENQCA